MDLTSLAKILSKESPKICLAVMRILASMEDGSTLIDLQGLSQSLTLPKSTLKRRLEAILSEMGMEREETGTRGGKAKWTFNAEPKKKPNQTNVMSHEDVLVIEVINYLENVTQRPQNRESGKKQLRARIKEGFSKEDFVYVIDVKWNNWRGTDYEKYVRPETLFNKSKFETYLHEQPTKNKLERISNAIAGATNMDW